MTLIMKKIILLFTALAAMSGSVNAQDINQIRWKSESQVRQILGEPTSITKPVGTHATYTMWKYPGYTVAFSNSKAFHLFRHDSLQRYGIEENRPR